MNEHLINQIMYADYLILISPSSAGLCQLLYECDKFGTSHDVKYNANIMKTIMIFRSNILKGCTILDVKLNEIILNMVVTYKYLGHYITDDLCGDADINKQCRTLFVQGNVILHTFYMCSIDVKLTLFCAHCSVHTVLCTLFTNVFCTVMV